MVFDGIRSELEFGEIRQILIDDLERQRESLRTAWAAQFEQ